MVCYYYMWTTVLDGISKARRGLCVPDEVVMEVLRFFDVCTSAVIRKVCNGCCVFFF